MRRHTDRSARTPRDDRRGLTLIEVVIALTIAALLAGVSTVGISAITDAELKSTAVTLSGVMKQAYDRAIMQQRTQRLVIDLDKSLWWLEYSTSPFALSRERLTGEKGEASAADEDEDDDRRSGIDARFGSIDEKTEVEAMLEGGAAMFAADTDVDAGKPSLIPGEIVVRKVWTSHQEEAFTSGTAYVHFFKSGQAEAALIELGDEGEDVITLEVQPLTGRVKMHRRSMPVPELEDEENLGRQEGDE